MNEKSIQTVIEIITGEIREGDAVNMTVSSRNGKLYFNLSNAPSWIVEAITNSGYYASVQYGVLCITNEEE